MAGHTRMRQNGTVVAGRSVGDQGSGVPEYARRVAPVFGTARTDANVVRSDEMKWAAHFAPGSWQNRAVLVGRVLDYCVASESTMTRNNSLLCLKHRVLRPTHSSMTHAEQVQYDFGKR